MGYDILINTLNKLMNEAPIQFKTYHPEPSNTDGINSAYARAYIHLYLKSIWGINSFLEREDHITDDPGDGGIDAYFIDSINKVIYYIQSKFRMNETGFTSRTIAIEDLFNMEIDLILGGNTQNSSGISFNDKILKMMEKISSIPDIADYSHKIVLLANIKDIPPPKLAKIFNNRPVEVYNYERSYNSILLPLLTSTSYDTSKLRIEINTSDKNKDSRMEYSLGGGALKCNILLTFVPAIEIAKILNVNKNSILKYNPRCYLDFEGSPINREIYSTILEGESHELALYNNGITLISDSAEFKSEIFKKGVAVLNITNPQIINGGQTASTILRIFQDCKNAEKILSGKELLLKVISFSNDSLSSELKEKLIRKISDASNKQNLITHADRRSNDEIQLKIQQYLFREQGLLYEKKKGEFFGGLCGGYISSEKILDRNFFVRIVLACLGELTKSSFKLVYKKNDKYNKIFREENLELFSRGLEILKEINKFLKKKELFVINSSSILPFLYVVYRKKELSPEKDISFLVQEVFSQRNSFENHIAETNKNKKYFRMKKEKIGDKIVEKIFFNIERYYIGGNVKPALDNFFKLN